MLKRVALLIPLILSLGGTPLMAQQKTAVRFQVTRETTLGTSVFVVGNIPELGANDVTRALKLSPTSYPDWFAEVELTPGTAVSYRYLTRTDAASTWGNAANATYIDSTPRLLIVPGEAPPAREGVVWWLSTATSPTLELSLPGGTRAFPLRRIAPGRIPGESLFRADLDGIPAEGDLLFRLALGGGQFEPLGGGFYRTALTRFWMQDGQVFNYRPAPAVSTPRVVKIPAFMGSLPTRRIYVYLPRGYDSHPNRSYPVLYMHDGRNVFEAFKQDANFGVAWQADTTATRLIREGRMRECLIVGVDSSDDRIAEYMPPYAMITLIRGKADLTAAYYMNEVAPWAAANYRVLGGRDNTAVAGSSMGGYFSHYLAWEFPQFARHYGIVSPAYWVNREGDGSVEFIDRLRTSPGRRDVRLWMDTGTRSNFTSPPFPVSCFDDGLPECFAARDALLERGYDLGPAFSHLVYIGADHSESDWAARLPDIFQFLFPSSQEAPMEDPFGEGWMLSGS